MISDTLSEAVDDIRRYLDDPVFADVYSGDIRQQIETTVSAMDATRVMLDTPPGYDPDRLGKLNRAAAARVREILDRPDPDHRELRSCDDFDPWDIFPSLYGSYDSAFDECAIEVLCEIRDGRRQRQDLAADMIREMLCTADLCDYGTSPRHCFPTVEFRALLPELINRWQAYSKLSWEEGP